MSPSKPSYPRRERVRVLLDRLDADPSVGVADIERRSTADLDEIELFLSGDAHRIKLSATRDQIAGVLLRISGKRDVVRRLNNPREHVDAPELRPPPPAPPVPKPRTKPRVEVVVPYAAPTDAQPVRMASATAPPLPMPRSLPAGAKLPDAPAPAPAPAPVPKRTRARAHRVPSQARVTTGDVVEGSSIRASWFSRSLKTHTFGSHSPDEWKDVFDRADELGYEREQVAAVREALEKYREKYELDELIVAIAKEMGEEHQGHVTAAMHGKNGRNSREFAFEVYDWAEKKGLNAAKLAKLRRDAQDLPPKGRDLRRSVVVNEDLPLDEQLIVKANPKLPLNQLYSITGLVPSKSLAVLRNDFQNANWGQAVRVFDAIAVALPEGEANRRIQWWTSMKNPTEAEIGAVVEVRTGRTFLQIVSVLMHDEDAQKVVVGEYLTQLARLGIDCEYRIAEGKFWSKRFKVEVNEIVNDEYRNVIDIAPVGISSLTINLSALETSTEPVEAVS